MKSLITTLFLSVFIIGASFAQNDRIDSLKQEIEKHSTSKNEILRLESLIALNKEYRKEKDYLNAIEVLKAETDDFGKEVDEETKRTLLVALAGNYYSQYYKDYDTITMKKCLASYEEALPFIAKSNDDYQKALDYSGYGIAFVTRYDNKNGAIYLKKALSFFEKNNEVNKAWIKCLGNLSVVYGNLLDIETALKYTIRAKELAKELEDYKMIARLSITTGELLINNVQYEFALKHFEEALKLTPKLKNADFIKGLCLLRLGIYSIRYGSEKELRKGRKQLGESHSIFTKLGNQRYLSEINKGLAVYYEKLEDYKTALLYSQKEIDYFTKVDQVTTVKAIAYLDKGRFFFKLNQYDSSNVYLLEALEITKSLNDALLFQNTYGHLTDLEEKRGNYEIALKYCKQQVAYKDSTYKEETNQLITKESVAQDVDSAERGKKEAELEAKVLAGRNKLFLAIALGLLGILLIGGYLYQQLRKTRKQLESQNTQLTQLNDTKDRFFGIIAHDIRGPITSLDGVGEQMSYYLKKNNTERVNKLTAQIDNTSKKLTNLLDNLLNWALMQTGTIPYHPKSLDIHDVVQENIDLYTEVADMKNIQLTNKVANGTLAFADMSAITTVVRNLINNAVKFTPDGGEISISTAVEHDKVLIEINDTGTGVSAERLNKIFELNTERKKGTAGEKGSGLGLLLCKDLVELNKGTIRAISELGKGSTFIFSLPTS
jgi:signal transduction histidine kinase